MNDLLCIFGFIVFIASACPLLLLSSAKYFAVVDAPCRDGTMKKSIRVRYADDEMSIYSYRSVILCICVCVPTNFLGALMLLKGVADTFATDAFTGVNLYLFSITFWLLFALIPAIIVLYAMRKANRLQG